VPASVIISRPDVIALIERAAAQLTKGNKTEAVALAVRRLLDNEARRGSLFGAHPGSVRTREGIDLTAPVLSDVPESESGNEIRR
jgi:hypothetical protein